MTKCFSLFGLSVSHLKIFSILKCGCLNGSNYLIYIGNCTSQKIYIIHSFNIFCPSSLTILVLHVALKQVDFFSHSFSRINSEKLIRTLPYEVPQKVYKINSSFLFQQILIEMLGMLRVKSRQ